MIQVSRRQPCFLDHSIRSWSHASGSLENSRLLWLESDMSFAGLACFKYLSTSRLYYWWDFGGDCGSFGRLVGPTSGRGSLLKGLWRLYLASSFCPAVSAFGKPSLGEHPLLWRTCSSTPCPLQRTETMSQTNPVFICCFFLGSCQSN